MPAWRSAIRLAATLVAAANVGLFAWVTAVLTRETASDTALDQEPRR